MSDNYGDFLINEARKKFNQERKDSDKTAKFLQERCYIGNDWLDKPFYIVQSELYDAYVEYTGEKPIYAKKLSFNKKLKKIGFQIKTRYIKDKSGGKTKRWCYIGVRLLSKLELDIRKILNNSKFGEENDRATPT